jgi:GH15 family glucan-1,4-alpha-glucosidase
LRGLYRKVACTEGSVELGVEFAPRYDYARSETAVDEVEAGAVATNDRRQATLVSPVELDVAGDAHDGDNQDGDDGPTATNPEAEREGETETEVEAGDGATARAEFALSEGEERWFVLRYSMHAPSKPDDCQDLLETTVDYWRDWVHSCDESECLFGGTGHDLVVRSELLLKLLTYRETGGIVAAPTTSLPEDVGGVRNWDYRFTWLRDGAWIVRALTNLEHISEAEDYIHRFLERTLEGDTAAVQPLYGVEGDTDLEEEELDHLRGYRDSRPVRVGNEAADQQQLDVYGELAISIYQRLWSLDELPDEDWEAMRGIADYVCDHWDDSGVGIWELRGEPRHLVHSKLMCWAAVDRAIQLAEREGCDAPLDEWRDCRTAIKEAVLEHGFDEELNSFTRAFDGSTMDATALLIPVLGFLPVDDPRIEGTIDAVMEHLMTDDGLVYRYEDDGLPGEEGAFVLCSFWLVDALTITGRTDEAWELFENLLEYASPLGLFAEEIDPETGEFLGNFPQGFSHLGLLNSALYLYEAEYDWATVGPLGTPTLVQEEKSD